MRRLLVHNMVVFLFLCIGYSHRGVIICIDNHTNFTFALNRSKVSMIVYVLGQVSHDKRIKSLDVHCFSSWTLDMDGTSSFWSQGASYFINVDDIIIFDRPCSLNWNMFVYMSLCSLLIMPYMYIRIMDLPNWFAGFGSFPHAEILSSGSILRVSVYHFSPITF